MRIVDEAPIVELTASDADSVLHLFSEKCLAFGQSLTDHGSNIIQRPNKSEFPIATSANKAAAMATNTEFFSLKVDGSKDRLFCYVLNGFPVGVAQSVGDELGFENLDALACNPGLNGCGGALIERIVDLSAENGREGKVCLYANSRELQLIYSSYGFLKQYHGKVNMTLVPAISPKWNLLPTPSGMRYRLNPKLSYIGD